MARSSRPAPAKSPWSGFPPGRSRPRSPARRRSPGRTWARPRRPGRSAAGAAPPSDRRFRRKRWPVETTGHRSPRPRRRFLRRGKSAGSRQGSGRRSRTPAADCARGPGAPPMPERPPPTGRSACRRKTAIPRWGVGDRNRRRSGTRPDRHGIGPPADRRCPLPGIPGARPVWAEEGRGIPDPGRSADGPRSPRRRGSSSAWPGSNSGCGAWPQRAADRRGAPPSAKWIEPARRWRPRRRWTSAGPAPPSSKRSPSEPATTGPAIRPPATPRCCPGPPAHPPPRPKPVPRPERPAEPDRPDANLREPGPRRRPPPPGRGRNGRTDRTGGRARFQTPPARPATFRTCPRSSNRPPAS